MICRICNSKPGSLNHVGRCLPCFQASSITEDDWDYVLRELGFDFYRTLAKSVVVDSRMAAQEGAEMGDA